MDVMYAIQVRRSIRAYKSTPVEEEKLSKVLEAARLSPSARNLQEWKFIVVKNEIKREQLTKASLGQNFVGQAPIILAACGKEPESIMECGQHRYTVDLSIAMSFMVLEAVEQGLGTCWLGRFDEKRVKEILDIPHEVRVVAMTPLGYSDENPAQRPRKSIHQIVSYDGWS